MIDGLTLWLLVKGSFENFAFGYPLALNLLRSAETRGAHGRSLRVTRVKLKAPTLMFFMKQIFTQIQLKYICKSKDKDSNDEPFRLTNVQRHFSSACVNGTIWKNATRKCVENTAEERRIQEIIKRRKICYITRYVMK